MLPLRQNAVHKVVIGPVVAVGDGFTPITTLALSTADEAEVILHDNGTVVDISGYTFAAITTADGYYHLTLQTGISGTVGHMTVVINDDSLCLPVRADFMVLEEAVYDGLYASSAAGYLQSTVAGRTLDVSASGALTLCDTVTTNTDMRGTDSAFLAASAPTNFSALGISVGGAISNVTLVATTTTNTDMRGTDSAALASALATAQADLDIITGVDGALFATAAIETWADHVPTGETANSIWAVINNTATAANLATVDANVDAILVDTGTTIPALIGTPVVDLATDIATVDANVDAILVDTGTTIPALIGTPVVDLATDIATVDANVDAILVDTGTTIPATIATVDANVDAILVDTGTTIPALLPTNFSSLVISVGGIVDANTQQINDVNIVGDGSGTPFNV